LLATKEGFTHVFGVIDAFTRWVMLYPTRGTNAEDCAKAMIQHFGIFGAPNEVVSDGGSQICNVKVREMISILTSVYKLGVIHHVNLAYSSEENGIVERANKEVMRYLRHIVFEQRRGSDWAVVLPFVQRICNAEVVSSMGYSPATLVFGTAIDLDRSVLTPNRVMECNHKALTPYVQQLIAVQKHALAAAAMIQRDTDARNIAERGGKDITEFAKGAHVLVEYPNKGMHRGPPNKLMTNLRGPMIVESSRGSDYSVRDLSTNVVCNVHVSRLRPFRFDATRIDPKEIAAKDIGEFYLESILDHRPRGQKRPLRGSLEFKVRWLGYDESHDSWEPWAELRSNRIVHAYCRAHDMEGIVPKNAED